MAILSFHKFHASLLLFPLCALVYDREMIYTFSDHFSIDEPLSLSKTILQLLRNSS